MKRDDQLYRLAEDHLILGLEGKIVKAGEIPFINMALYDAIGSDEYPYEIKFTPGYSHSGLYRFDIADDVDIFIEKITGTKVPCSVDNSTLGITRLHFSTHRGHFDFHVRIINKPA